MSGYDVDVFIAGAGPVGLMCAHLAQLCGLTTAIVDKSEAPLQVGRADALNARTLQLLELANLFDELYVLGKPCNTSSIWANGNFVSRQSSWWDELSGCAHKHFLMLGQSYVENLLDRKLIDRNAAVRRMTSIVDVQADENGCQIVLSTGEMLSSRYLIGADGSRSFVREAFAIPFEIVRPQLIWAVIDGVIETDFAKVPEIIVFQAATSDVAWIPREGGLDRFYVRMDTKVFTIEDAIEKINRAMKPKTLSFKEVQWFSQFSVKESVAESFMIKDRVFLAGDSCHIHSVNGGQGLNTGIADAFNLIWKINMVENFGAPKSLLKTYEAERKPVALSVIATSSELVRATKFSDAGTHAADYVKIVERRSGNITGMGIAYDGEGLSGQRLFDFPVFKGREKTRIYSLLSYSKYTLLIFGDLEREWDLPAYIQIIPIKSERSENGYWTSSRDYIDQAILVRPDSYIACSANFDQFETLMKSVEAKW